MSIERDREILQDIEGDIKEMEQDLTSLKVRRKILIEQIKKAEEKGDKNV